MTPLINTKLPQSGISKKVRDMLPVSNRKTTRQKLFFNIFVFCFISLRIFFLSGDKLASNLEDKKANKRKVHINYFRSKVS